jgi:hypothetical protein
MSNHTDHKEHDMSNEPTIGDQIAVTIEAIGFDGLTPEYQLTPDHPHMDPVDVVCNLDGLAAAIAEAFGVDVLCEPYEECSGYIVECEVVNV